MTSDADREMRKDLHARLGEVYESRGAELCAFAWRLLDGRGSADDLVHEAFMRVLDGRCRVDASRGTLDLLLFGIVRTVAREVLRRATTDAQRAERSRAEGTASTLPVDDDVLAVRAALLEQSVGDREVMLLSTYHGNTPREIAVALGVPSATVRVRLFRARRRLRRLLGASMPVPASSGKLSHER
jgi:RNA polymerase sigma-70 factor, ECF subfamily